MTAPTTVNVVSIPPEAEPFLRVLGQVARRVASQPHKVETAAKTQTYRVQKKLSAA